MKLMLDQDLVLKLRLDSIPTARPDGRLGGWQANPEGPGQKPNFIIYDSSPKSPTGFAVRVGKKRSVYIVEKKIDGKLQKFVVADATGADAVELSAARLRASEMIAETKRTGVSPGVAAAKRDAAEITLGEAWEEYKSSLTTRAEPIKDSTKNTLQNAWRKLEHWKDRKVRTISAREVLDLFEEHAADPPAGKGHRTAAEQMGRWVTAAVDHAIALEAHDAASENRPPVLTYNPFTILKTEKKYRGQKKLEQDYKKKGVRNPLVFSTTLGPWIEALWNKRPENPIGCDFLLLTLLWGMRRGESCKVKWRDLIDDKEALTSSWVCLKEKKVFLHDTKNRMDVEMPIAPCAMEILRRRREFVADWTGPQKIWVFPSRSSRAGAGHYSCPNHTIQVINEAAGVKTFRGHDMRRTFGAVCERLGFTDLQIKRMLGHSDHSNSTDRYSRADWDVVVERSRRVEETILSAAPAVYNALRPSKLPRMGDDVVIGVERRKRSQAKPR